MDIREYLKKYKLISDGAMGTYYNQITNSHQMSEMANIDNSEIIKKIHIEYINAGAKLIRTNTFGANTLSLGIDKEELKKIIISGYNLAKESVLVSGEEVFVAANIGPIRQNTLTEDLNILEEYKEICDIFMESGAEIVLLESFSDLKYIKQLVKYIKEKKDIFIIVQFTLDKNGYTSLGISGQGILDEVSKIQEIDSCGFNCGVGSGHMYQLIKKIIFPENKYISIMPNAGYPDNLYSRMVYQDNASYFADKLKDMKDLGVDIFGGCCGTTPNHIKKINKSITKDNIKILYRDNIKTDSTKKEVLNNEFLSKLMTGKKVVAVELDPPFNADSNKIMENSHNLKKLNIDMITFADSPMGRSRVDSILMSAKILKDVSLPVMPHVCCRDKNMISMRSTILGAYLHDIRNLLIVTGDPIPSETKSTTTSVFDYDSIRLMNFINQMNKEHFESDPICFGGALNYSRKYIDKEIERVHKKIEAGAKYFLTQPIFSDEDIEKIKYIKEKTNTKILCGIMPLISYKNALFIKNEIYGINVDDEIVNRYNPNMTREESEQTGITLAVEIIEKLGESADGYYFMLPFNRVSLLDGILNEIRR